MVAMEPMEPRTVSDGVRKLRAFLTNHSLSIQRFCIAHGLDRIAVQRLLKGERGIRMGVELAADIEDATDGEVPMRAWVRDETVAA